MSNETIHKLERGVAVRRRTLAAIRTALEEAGIEFINCDAPGVQLRKPPE